MVIRRFLHVFFACLIVQLATAEQAPAQNTIMNNAPAASSPSSGAISGSPAHASRATFPSPVVQYLEFSYHGQIRQYLMHTPRGWDQRQTIPLLIALHGGGGNAAQFQRYAGFDTLADRFNFAVIYPNALHRHWNDERGDLHLGHKLDHANDIGFIQALVDSLTKHTPIGGQKVILTGISNGGIMSIKLACQNPQQYSGIAPVAASMAMTEFKQLQTQLPKALPEMLLINGTADPLVPYYGGEITVFRKHRGKVIGTDSTISFWAKVNRNQVAPCDTFKIPNTDTTDGCNALRLQYCSTNTAPAPRRLFLIKIINGGHTMPGKHQYLPKSIIGNTCRDFNAASAIARFYFSDAKR